MSILDKNALFSGSYSGSTWTGQSIQATGLSTNVVDLGPTTSNTLRDLGQGKDLYLVILTKDAVTRAAGACTVTFSLESDSVTTIDSSATVHYTTAAISKPTAGSVVVKQALPVGKTYERYLAVRYTFSATADAGSFIAALTTNPDEFAAYANAYDVTA